MELKIKSLKFGCYFTSITMSVILTLSPLLFITFRELYGISYSLLGLLILVNFFTQLVIDLIFSFFSHKFNISLAVKITPVLSVIGLVIYAVWPYVFPQNVYLGLLIGTIIFSAASGFSEVLTSPVFAKIPADDPDREMSKLHSMYAWGVVFVVVFSTIFLLLAGNKNWQILALIFTIIPLIASVLLANTAIPEIEKPENTKGALKMLKDKGVWLCIFAIFLGSAAECTMSQWGSGYLEKALLIPKVYGDVFGVALFSVMLGLGRSLYAKFGKNIGKILTFSAVGATVCYFVAAVSNNTIVGLGACALTGICTAMLWPGNLVVASNRYPQSGVFIYAMMAAGGDLGASVGPQFIGVITDFALKNPDIIAIATNIGLSAEQLGMKIGMLCGMLFPLVAIPLNLYMWKSKKQS